MKRNLLILIFILTAPILAGENESKKFEVTFTIKYNALTLEQAAKLEKEIREHFEDACDIDLSLKNVVSSVPDSFYSKNLINNILHDYNNLQWTDDRDLIVDDDK